MKIYFAGSIRGGRIDAMLYHRMVTYIEQTDAVLTHHVGNLNLQEDQSDRAIYERDTAWLRECDCVVAECSNPSLGVGYELAYAECLGKPVHIFYNRFRNKLSAMLAGNGYFHVHAYDEERDVYPVLDEILGRQSDG